MIYTDMIKLAMRLLYIYNNSKIGEMDGCPSIFHPYHIAEQMDDEDSCTVALLHDIIEDTSLALYNLKAWFPNHICEAVDLLTRKEGVPYLDYIKNLKKNPLARKVKLADLEHNMDMSRLDGKYVNTHAKQIIDMQKRYEKAKKILLEEE